jgi:hypothetical protein
MAKYVKWLIKQSDPNSPRHKGKVSLEDDDNAKTWVARGFCEYYFDLKNKQKPVVPLPTEEVKPEPKKPTKAEEVEAEARVVEKPPVHRAMLRKNALRKG